MEARCANGARGFTCRRGCCGDPRELKGGFAVDEGAVVRGLAARIGPEPEPVPAPVPVPDPIPVPVAPSPLPVDAPRELEERFEPGCAESVEAQGLGVPPSSACFLL